MDFPQKGAPTSSDCLAAASSDFCDTVSMDLCEAPAASDFCETGGVRCERWEFSAATALAGMTAFFWSGAARARCCVSTFF